MSQKLKTTPKPSPKNTLFNYFAKNTPNTPKEDGEVKTVPKEDVDEKPAKQIIGKQLDFGKITSAYYKQLVVNAAFSR